MRRRKGIENIPGHWFSMRPGMSPGFWVAVSQECKRKGISKSDTQKVASVIKELTPIYNCVVFNMLHILNNLNQEENIQDDF